MIRPAPEVASLVGLKHAALFKIRVLRRLYERRTDCINSAKLAVALYYGIGSPSNLSKSLLPIPSRRAGVATWMIDTKPRSKSCNSCNA